MNGAYFGNKSNFVHYIICRAPLFSGWGPNKAALAFNCTIRDAYAVLDTAAVMIMLTTTIIIMWWRRRREDENEGEEYTRRWSVYIRHHSVRVNSWDLQKKDCFNNVWSAVDNTSLFQKTIIVYFFYHIGRLVLYF